MRRLALVVLSALIVAAPAAAQNPGQIARVRAGASCPRCNLFQADLGGLALRGRDFTGARLRQADAQAAVLTHARLAHADLRDLNAYGAVLTGANLRGADLTAATLVGAYLQGADLSGAVLVGTNLSGTEMSRARGLSARQLSAACGDAATTLPRGFSVKPCS